MKIIFDRSEDGKIKQWDLEDPFKNSQSLFEQKHPVKCIQKSLANNFDLYLGIVFEIMNNIVI